MAQVKIAEDIESELVNIVQAAYDNSNDEIFFVGLSGGSLPKLLVKVFRRLQNVDWKKWLFFFCDERCVPSNSADSTFGEFRRLLDPVDEKLPLSLNQFITIDPSLKCNKVSEDYVSKMRQRFDKESVLPRFHVLFLGLGPDGHTCSLFPEHRLLKVGNRIYTSLDFDVYILPNRKIISTIYLLTLIQETTKWVAYIGDSPKPPPERITMTLPILNNSKMCLFVATGESKASVIKEILVDEKPLPAGLVKPSNGQLIWLLDKAAASKLPSQLGSS